MFTLQERLTAINLYFKYGKKYAPVLRDLGYPKNRKSLYDWVNEFEKNGSLQETYSRTPKYSLEQKKAAVNHYLNHGKNMEYTRKQLGYPNRHDLRKWIDELALRVKL